MPFICAASCLLTDLKVTGEKIAIKANINGSAVFDDDTSGETQMSYTNPVLLKALLISLVKEGGVNPSDITVYDVSRLFPDYMVKMCTAGELSGFSLSVEATVWQMKMHRLTGRISSAEK